ncbi:MAG: penicillin acylase family protein [Anaerolineales bacterium]|nr:penicillin acylase family protein [Anaerolineales bacterium]
MTLPQTLLRLLTGQRLPQTSGTLHVPGLTAPLTIRRDAHGIPYVTAVSPQDAWFGLGFCQGQDRPFQLEMLLRLTRGTLAAAIGAPGLPLDRLSRRLGFHRAAQAQADALDPAARPVFDAFARGVTAGASLGSPKPAPEFALLRIAPTPWTVPDVLAGLNYIAFGLSAWSAKLSRLILLHADGPDALRALDADYPDWNLLSTPVAAAAGPALDRLAADLASLAGLLGLRPASNNWAIAGSRTASGRPILANDPHLEAALPAPWYLVHLRTPGWSVAGASFVGAPIIPAGHNDVAAWGVTAGVADNVDLYLEELSPDGRSVRDAASWAPCTLLEETIAVKGQEPVVETIRLTPRGPIISDVLNGVPDVLNGVPDVLNGVPDVLDGVSATLAMRATWMAPRSFHGVVTLHHATDFAAFRAAALASSFASLNLVYADTAGQIGWTLIGPVPRRQGSHGTLPLPGWDPAHAWAPDALSPEEMPHLLNPDAGFVATANNKPRADAAGPYLGRDWVEGYRHARIVALLNGRSDWTVGAAHAMQHDQLAIPWREMRAAVLAAPATDAHGQTALRLLAAWDGVTAADSAAAAVYEFFVIDMVQRLAAAKAPNAAAWALGRGFHPLLPRSFFLIREVSLLVRLLRTQPDGWFAAGWPATIAAALSAAAARLTAALGPQPDAWQWGAVHPLLLAHPLGSRPPLDRLFNRGPFPVGGDHQSIAQAGRPSSEFGGHVVGIANLRMVLDVGYWDDNRFVLAGGQSGSPTSPHYDDLLALWLRGAAITMPWTEPAITRATRATLHLQVRP